MDKCHWTCIVVFPVNTLTKGWNSYIITGIKKTLVERQTSCPNLQPNSSDTLLATDIAATLLGWVQPIFPLIVYPDSAKYCVI